MSKGSFAYRPHTHAAKEVSKAQSHFLLQAGLPLGGKTLFLKSRDRNQFTLAHHDAVSACLRPPKPGCGEAHAAPLP